MKLSLNFVNEFISLGAISQKLQCSSLGGMSDSDDERARKRQKKEKKKKDKKDREKKPKLHQVSK